jgi:hypothetical protein
LVVSYATDRPAEVHDERDSLHVLLGPVILVA